MANTTNPDSIPYVEAGDPVSNLDEHLFQLAARLQALVKNLRTVGGVASITPTATNTPTTKRVDFGVTFANADPPVVTVCLAENASSTNVVNLWATAIDNTGFTLGINASNTAARTVTWTAVPRGWV